MLFVLAGCVIYYHIPRKAQWLLLLCMSILFYISFDIRLIGYVLASALSVFIAVNKVEPLKRGDKTKKRILIITLIFNFGLLAFVKYTDFMITNLDTIFSGLRTGIQIPGINILVPIGISFYTFQITGYLLDVYWGRDKAEKSFPRFLLFVSFFPQMIQGPISKHKSLAAEFDREHVFSVNQIKYGIQLMLWGLFKKIVIADTAAVAVSSVYDHIGEHQGITVIAGVLCYCIQLYCDFSGGIDVVRGVAELFDINIADNFKRPFFSKSISEFWRRWHITLGIWMKDYIFYPISLSKWMNRLGGKCRKVFGNQIGRKLPVCLANLIVFFLVGVWHGPNWQFIVYGLYNGLIIAISSLLVPVYNKLYEWSGIRKEAKAMQVFQIVRTFILVNLGWYFDRSQSLTDALLLMRNTFMVNQTHFTEGGYLGLYKYQYAYMLLGCLIILIVSIMQERGIRVRAYIDTKPLMIKWCIWLFIIFAIPLMGYFSPYSNLAGGFMYANF